MRSSRLAVAFFSFVLILSTNVCAEEESFFWIKNEARYFFTGEVKAKNVDVLIGEDDVNFGHTFKLGELPIDVGYTGNHIILFDHDPLDLPHNMKSRGLDIGTKFPVPFVTDDRFLLGTNIYPQFNTAIGFGLDARAFRLPFSVYLVYNESEDFKLIGGVLLRPRYETNAVPFLGLIYRPNEVLSFNLIPGDAHIAYQLTEQTKLLWSFDYAFNEYYTTEDPNERRVWIYRYASTGIGVEHEFNATFAAALKVGGVFGRRIESTDEAVKVVIEPSPYAQLDLKLTF